MKVIKVKIEDGRVKISFEEVNVILVIIFR